MSQPLEIKTGIQVQKPVTAVFEAIVDPAQMSHYFISKSSGRIEAGKTLTWNFPEFEAGFPVRIEQVEQDKYVSFYWDVNNKPMLVEITLTPEENDSTVVTVTEKSQGNDEAGIQWLKSNTEGWAYFLACMKAYLEYGINLRKGAFTYRFK
ncbi:Uncharacterized conserved protein YndB, AHSA1/START domain [Filimonas lacunae]|uniref:Uncharacterized conserved protein YndB, AHSA1/START domain n=1 Tax=Filimonas lacunae TaxID=477680 RepID=A0A1N7R3Q2_9BACT|nr:SRPBCC family protein [Filimonas lacunae]SIT29751.1 Uncharacterized conserved protein YndB, AHSA1/START domain [Filimonas lacunae]